MNSYYYDREAPSRADQEQTPLPVTIPLLALALVVGVALALLFSPKGEDTRKDISDKVDDVLGRHDSTPEALRQLEHSFADLRKKVEEGLAQFQR
ncbi:MAG: YtxH domain-containing protein [Anaerolineae bacterium]|nr:YtxH domain-containing protein [Anaerolineae bacterium]